ncbi:MAG: hypothetical protein AAFN30_20130 [Actinomycetota bacterium]
MIGLYVLAAVIGLPLVGYAVLSGDGDGDVGEFDGGDGGVLGYLSIGTLSFFAGFFGLTGLAVTAAGTGTIATLIAAIAVGLVAALAQHTLLNYVRRSSSSSHLSDADFTGKAARVVIPVQQGKRGRIALQLGEQEHYLTAELTDARAPAALDVGTNVVIVDMDGGVAQVAHLDPELA